MSRRWRALKDFARECGEDRLVDEGAKVAYYFFLSLFPLILTLFAVTGIIGGDRAFHWITGQIGRVTPPETGTYLTQFVREVTNKPRPGMLSIGAVLTIWSASAVFVALGDSLNVMYEVRETRSFLRRRAGALLVLALGGTLAMLGSVMVIAGPEIAQWLHLGRIAPLFGWPIALVLLIAFVALTLYVLPNRDQRHSLSAVLLAATIGALAWIGAGALFRLYVTHFGSYSRTYGFVGAVIVLLLWLQVTSVAILLGGKVAARLERSREPVFEERSSAGRHAAPA